MITFAVTMWGFEVRKDGRVVGVLDRAGFAPAVAGLRFTRADLLAIASKCLEVFQS